LEDNHHTDAGSTQEYRAGKTFALGVGHCCGELYEADALVPAIDGLELNVAELVRRGMECMGWVGFLEGEVLLESLDPALQYDEHERGLEKAIR
jgi:hypothetical protein